MYRAETPSGPGFENVATIFPVFGSALTSKSGFSKGAAATPGAAQAGPATLKASAIDNDENETNRCIKIPPAEGETLVSSPFPVPALAPQTREPHSPCDAVPLRHIPPRSRNRRPRH